MSTLAPAVRRSSSITSRLVRQSPLLLPSLRPLSFSARPRLHLPVRSLPRAHRGLSTSPSVLSSMMSSSDSTDDWTRLQELIEKAKFTMMATLTDDGSIRSRPMATQHINHDERGILWFFTGKDSHKVDELNANPHVNLGYIGDGQSLFISVTGTAELVLDHAKMKELWTEVLKAWFPQGLDDPNIALLKVTVRSAELWNSASPKLVQLYGFAKAKLTGEPHRDEGQEHRKITL